MYGAKFWLDLKAQENQWIYLLGIFVMAKRSEFQKLKNDLIMDKLATIQNIVGANGTISNMRGGGRVTSDANL